MPNQKSSEPDDIGIVNDAAALTIWMQQLWRWRLDRGLCPDCATPLVDGGIEEFCPNCPRDE